MYITPTGFQTQESFHVRDHLSENKVYERRDTVSEVCDFIHLKS